MTIREALAIAEAELGCSSEATRTAAKHADSNVPMAIGFTNSEIEPGAERAFIEGMKEIILKLKANPEALAATAKLVQERIKKQAERN